MLRIPLLFYLYFYSTNNIIDAFSEINMSSLIQIEQSPVLYSKKSSNIDEEINNLVRKIKNQDQIPGDFAVASTNQQRVVLSQRYEDIHSYSVYHQLIIWKSKRTIRSRTIICKNNSPLFLSSLQQKRMVMNWLFCGLTKNTYNLEQKISINPQNGIITLYGPQIHVKSLHEVSKKLFPIIKIIYFFQRRFIIYELPKLLYTANLLPEDYQQIYLSSQIYKDSCQNLKFLNQRKIVELNKIYRIIGQSQSQFLSYLAENKEFKQPDFPSKRFQKYSILYGLLNINDQYSNVQLPIKQIQNYLLVPQPKEARMPGQNKYIFNYITILDEKNFQPKLAKRGGFSNIMFVYSKFQYLETVKAMEQKKTTNKVSLQQSEFQRPILNKYFCLKIAKSVEFNYTVQHQKKVLSNFRQMFSPYLLKYYVCTAPSFAYRDHLMMDAINTPNLNQFLYVLSNTTSLMTKLFYLSQISNSIRFFKEYKLAHLDLKLNNVLILFRQFLIKIIDFGQTYQKQACQKNYKPGHTMPYAPPQLLQRQKCKFTYKSDIFSFGIMLFETLFDKYPFFDMTNLKESFRKKTYLKKVVIVPQAFDHYCNPKLIRIILSLILKCINPNEAQRPQPQSITILLKICLSFFAELM